MEYERLLGSVIIYYFTGTGNARRLADLAAAALRARGCDVTVQNIEHGLSYAKHNKVDCIGLVTPVYGFGLPQMVVNFLKTLSRGNGQLAFLLVATGNTEYVPLGKRTITVPPTEGIAILQARYWLRRHNYQLMAALPIEMPTNWTLVVNPPHHEEQEYLFRTARTRVEKAMDELLREDGAIVRPRWWAVPLLALAYFGFIHVGRRILGKFFASTPQCNGCRTCLQHCPSQTITWKHSRPYWGWNCQQCFRCVNYCPRGAIDVPGVSLSAYLLASIFGDAPVIWLSLGTIEWLRHYHLGHLASVWIYATMVFAVVWLLHYLHVCPLTRWAMPRWYAMRKRVRYREPHFFPEAHQTDPTPMRTISAAELEASPAAKLPRTVWVKMEEPEPEPEPPRGWLQRKNPKATKR